MADSTPRPSVAPATGGKSATGGQSFRARREAIRRILKANAVGTQEELGRLLQLEGHEVTQATLSRDLAKLRARRVPAADGGTIYELEIHGGAQPESRLRAVRTLILNVEEGEAMVVVRTIQGGAAAVAAALDTSPPRSVLGSLAGDDTIFVVPRKGVKPARVKRELLALWSKGAGL